MSSVSVSNCIKFYQTAEDIGAKDLQKYCAEIISNHWVGYVIICMVLSTKILFREMGLFCLLVIAFFVPTEAKFFGGVIFLPYTKSFIDQGCKVKMAGYWPRYFFFSFLWTSTEK